MTARTPARADVLTLKLPLPPAALAPNARVHFHRRAVETRGYALAVLVAVRQQLGPEHGITFAVAEMDLTFVFPNRRRRDVDNLLASFKAGLDCLVSVGLLKDDSAEHLPRVTVTRRVEADVTPHVEVTLREVTG